ncbi:hypothetical protein L1887_03448 [Cichorium endivia]|nr:hypothetical protein L1887_03448 [Cichorium endivia]
MRSQSESIKSFRRHNRNTVSEVDQSVNQDQILNRRPLLQLNKRSRSVMDSEIYISDEGEASENSSMEMIEVSENSGGSIKQEK